MSDKEPTKQEALEAEALAKALDGDGTGHELAGDALETAALLRASHDSGELSAERENAVLQKILAEARNSGQKDPIAWLRWLIPAGGLAAAAVVGIVFASGILSPFSPASLPKPDITLLKAQSEAARGDPASISVLRTGMQTYRRSMYASLSEHYSG
ncbi:MAG: hypothetical protein JRJ87_21195 [Deltaproteobacteria bacterium]|nr:hypothetical protein [Deltaproteobacteria bacterium]